MDRAIIFVIDIVLKAGYGCLRIILTDNDEEVTNKLIKSIHGRENAVEELWGRQGVGKRGRSGLEKEEREESRG